MSMGRWGAVYRIFIVALLSSFPQAFAKSDTTTSARDLNQVSIIVSDFDGSFAHNLGHYVVRLAPNPGMPGLGEFSGLPDKILVPVHDYEGNVGPRVRDLLGHFNQGQFIPSAALDEITLSNGQKIIPGYYYVDPVDTFREFRPRATVDESILLQRVKEKLDKNEPFLLEAAAFVGAAHAQEFQHRLIGAMLTMRGHSPKEMQASMNMIRDRMEWGPVEWALEAYINLTHPQFSEFGQSKERFVRELFNSLAQRMMQDFSTPHFLVVLENDRRYLAGLKKTMHALSTNGVYANPVVPILVSLVEPEVHAVPNGVDWDRSALETAEKTYRVTVFWGSKIEETDNLARVFELTLGQTPQEARATYKKYVNSFWCRDLLTNSQGKQVRKAGQE